MRKLNHFDLERAVTVTIVQSNSQIESDKQTRTIEWQKQYREIASDEQTKPTDWQKRCREIVNDYQTTASLKKISKGNPVGRASWLSNYQKLLEIRKKYGHCHVPSIIKRDLALDRWVKRQRFHYYLYANGKPSPMNKERVELLEDLGFIWRPKEALWHERFGELLEFKRKYGHCVVPTIFPENQPLATWTKLQRRQYKLYHQGKQSYLSKERIFILDQNGFQWSCS